MTKWDHLWQFGSIDDNNALPKFLFSRNKPASINGTEWRLVNDIRREIGDDNYDKSVRKLFTMLVDDPETRYHDIDSAWTKFMNTFIVLDPIFGYNEVWRDYYRQVLEELHEDNVQYLELRSVFPELYDLDGNKFGPMEVAQIYADVTKEFKSTHPDFLGSKVIYAPCKTVKYREF